MPNKVIWQNHFKFSSIDPSKGSVPLLRVSEAFLLFNSTCEKSLLFRFLKRQGRKPYKSVSVKTNINHHPDIHTVFFEMKKKIVKSGAFFLYWYYGTNNCLDCRILDHKKWTLKTLLLQCRIRGVGYTLFFNPWHQPCYSPQFNLSRLRHHGTSDSTKFTLADENLAKRPRFRFFGTAARVANVTLLCGRVHSAISPNDFFR